MSIAVHGPARQHPSGLPDRLTAALRPEFTGALIRIDPDNPVFARGRCTVRGCQRGAWARLLCGGHYQRWLNHARPELSEFVASTGTFKTTSDRVDAFDLRRLRPLLRAEVAYSIQCRHDDRTVRLIPTMINRLVELLLAGQVSSLLEHSPAHWKMLAREHALTDPGGRAMGQLGYAWRHLHDLYEDRDIDTEFARDLWRAQVLGVRPSPKGITTIRFDHFDQPWLRAAVKRACRYRLGAGKTFGSVSIDERALRWFATFLTRHYPHVSDPTGITREVLEHYLSYLTAAPELSANTTNTYLIVLRNFLQACHRHDWMPGLPAHAEIYLDDLPPRPRPLPRFIPEFVMAQLEDPANLARLPDQSTRNLIILLQETGLRARDACVLEFNPIIYDSDRWPCLKYYNHKMAIEQLLPLSTRAADAVRDQQDQLRHAWPQGCSQLFPAPVANPDGARPFNYATLRARLARWQDDISLHDETGQRLTVTAHQFRHTLGTRLINSGVPQHVVQKMLGHASPQMTARYATIHDSTVRAAFEDYQQHRVDIHGDHLPFDPDAPSAEAEWIKHNLARVQAALPNGYCGCPPQQHCPHPNACLTCPDFQTTPVFLPIHRRQRDDTLQLIDVAEHNGNTRLVTNHRAVLHHLENVISVLETLPGSEETQ